MRADPPGSDASPSPIPPPPPQGAGAHIASPATPTPATVPTCWKCRYDLTRLRVEDNCPECGTPVWSGPGAAGEQMYPEAFAWGLASLILGAALIGPLAAFIAIPAIVKGRR